MTHRARACAFAHAVGLLICTGVVTAGDASNLIQVTTTADGINHGDGLCSLREAVRNASLNVQGSAAQGECAAGSATVPDVILLASGATYSLTVPGNGDDQGDLTLFQAVPIDLDLRMETQGAAPATIEQTVVGQRVMQNQGLTLKIDNLVLRGGDVGSVGNGGGLLNAGGAVSLSRTRLIDNHALGGGAIHNSGTLEIFDGELLQNSANGSDGGAVFNAAGGSVQIRNTLIRENTSSFGAGAIHHEGVSLELLQGCEIELNAAQLGDGGAIRVLGAADLLVDDAFFDSNQATGSGGGIASSSSGDVVVSDSSFLNHFGASGGAVNSSGASLLIERSRFSNNSASGPGGAIRALTLVMRHTRVEDNTAFSASGSGGGIQIDGFASISNSVVKGNGGSHGGGIHASVLQLQDSLLELNTSSGNGGGVFVQEQADLLRVRSRANQASAGSGLYLASGGAPSSLVRQSLFDGNTANGDGGGMWLGSTASIGNTTVTLNVANGNGGGLYVASAGNVTAVNISLVENPDGRDLHKLGQFSMQNSLISSVGQPNCLVGGSNPQIVSLGNNLSDDATCTGLGQPGDQTSVDPLLQGFADNGGGTLTYAPALGSPTIDAGNNAACAESPVNGLDQRGALRPAGVACDIGAHEFGAEPPALIFRDGFEPL